ncbi:unnamed protein product, partial [Symbiodinium sp. CCMP2456]
DEQALQAVDQGMDQQMAQVESREPVAPGGSYRKYSMVGKVGRGRHGDEVERASTCAHMRSEKRAKKAFEQNELIVQTLQDSVLVKEGKTLQLSVKGSSCGLKISLHKVGSKGNRFARKIHFASFIKSSFGMNTNNVALAAMMNLDKSTVPRLQKTVAGVFMASQAKILARLCSYCQANPPTCVHHHVKWDETTVATSLNPGGASQSVKSAWSVLVVRARILISWPSGAMLQLRLVMPTVPMMTCSAEQIFHALEHHPSFYTINGMVRLLQKSAQLAATLHEVDGAYANIRLHNHFLSMGAFDPSEKSDGVFLESARCQSHATHLISVAMLALIGGNLLNRYYGLAVFMRNLGYLLRLQMALQQWIQELGNGLDGLEFGERVLWYEHLVFRCPSDESDDNNDESHEPDALMSETVDFLRTWHHGRDADGEDEHSRHSQFEERLENFVGMWNGSFSGYPVHHCCADHCISRDEAARKMSSTFIELLLTTLPSVPAPGKCFPASDFVGLGILINNFLPIIFDLAFKPVMFSADLKQDEAADPRLVEGLFFHAVQGKRFEASKEFLHDADARWGARCWLLVSEHLRRLVFFGLRGLKADKKISERFVICEVLDKGSSIIWAVLQNIAHQLMDKTGGGRLCMIWQASDCKSFAQWCSTCPQEVRALRRVLLALSGWVFRRHVAYWDEFPWALLQFCDPSASPEVVSTVKQRWDEAASCCVPAGWARSLKKLRVDADTLHEEPKYQMLLSGYGRLLQLTIADVECKHALSRHWSDRPFPTLTAKHINAEAKTCVQEASEQLKSLRSKSPCCKSAPADSRQVVSMRQKQIRSKSAYMFLRDDLLRTATISLNPCTKEFWKELQGRWDSLTPVQQAFYEEKAKQSQMMSDQKRREKRALSQGGRSAAPCISAGSLDAGTQQLAIAGAPQPLAPQPPGPQPLQTDTLPSIPYNPWLLASEASVTEDVGALCNRVADVVKAPTSAAPDLVDEHLRDSPVSQGQLESWWRDSLNRGLTWAQCLLQYNRESQRFSIPPPGSSFPDKVTYHGHCGCFCRNRASPRDVLSFLKLLQAFNQVAQAGTLSDILLKLTLGQGLSHQYVWMTAQSARSGVHQPSQIFILTDEMNAEAEGGYVRVVLRAGPLLGSRVPWCQAALQHGPLVHETEQSFAKSLLNAAHDIDAELVTVSRMSFQDVDLCTVEVTGKWIGSEDLVIHLLPDEEHPEDSDPRVAAPPSAAVLPDAGPGEGFDLLEEVLHGPRRARGRGRGRGRGGRTSADLRQGLIASLPFDPASMQDELESELQSLLQEHHVLLPPEPAANQSGDAMGDLLQDPVMSASLPEAFGESLQEAVTTCQQADAGLHAIFPESDDEQVQGESLGEDAFDAADGADGGANDAEMRAPGEGASPTGGIGLDADSGPQAPWFLS